MHVTNLALGDAIDLGPRKVLRDEIIIFAKEFDQAPFHLDEAAAKQTMLGGLCASGWQTCALTLRMMHDACFKNHIYLGAQDLEDCKWLKPLYVNEEISGKATLIDRKVEGGKMFASFQYDISNQNGDMVLSMKHTSIFSYEHTSDD